MTAKAALCMAFLQGKIINVRTCFNLTGLSNTSREVIRMVEKPFKVEVDRSHEVGITRYGTPSSWVNYRLRRTAENKEGIEKMKAYVQEQMASAKEFNKKTPEKVNGLFD